MSRRRRVFAIAVFVVVPAILGRVGAQSRDVDVRQSLSRTAVWVADRVIYTITIACNKGVDVLAEDLASDKLHVDGLEILGSDSERTTAADERTIYTFRYVLTTYRVDTPELKIAPLTVRYYVRRAGQRLGDASPAGEVQVPAAVIAFRSALPDGQDRYAMRDAREPRPRARRYAWLRPIGVGLVVLSVVPVAVAAISVARRTRPRDKPRSARQVRHDERASLEALQALDVSTADGRRDAYARANALVRDHLHAATGVDVSGLTPAEIGPAMRGHDGRLPLELAATVLGACDRARYAPPDALPSSDACRQTIEQTAQVVAG